MVKISSLFSRFLMIMALMVAGFSAYAQNSFSVRLKLVDDKTDEPVGYATASLTVKGEDQASKYVLTDSHGVAEIAKVKKGTYVLKAEIMGYKTYEQEIIVEKTMDLGTIRMAEDVETLDAASVSAVGNPIVVKKDTVEYTASSFKTSDNDMLEDLLKKLPGVEVNSDGTITANGETISKIMVDGKEFFMDDPQLASKNLPANMVEKVKVVERKSEQAMFTGIDDGQEEFIIDLSIYKGMMDGWFGNVMAGGGHDMPDKGYYNDEHKFMDEGWRYQSGAIVGNFKDHSQLTFILNANNTNNRGFNDLAGGMMGGMMGGGGMGGGMMMGGGMAGGGGMGGMMGGSGITSSWMGGLNGAWDLFDGDMELSGNYLYNGSNILSEQESSKITYMTDGSSQYYDETSTSVRNTGGHRIGIRLDHEFSPNSSILFEPQFNFGGGDFNQGSEFSTRTLGAGATEQTFTNDGFTKSFGDNTNWTASGRFLYRQRLGKAGRTLSLNANYNFSNNDMTSFNQSLTRTAEAVNGEYVYDPASGMYLQAINQKYLQNTKSSSLTGRLVYTEPLLEQLYLEASYQYSWSRSNSTKSAFDSGSYNYNDFIYNPKGETENATYSNSILNQTINQRAGLTFSYQTDKLTAQVGMSANPTNTHNVTNGETYDNTVVNWAPEARVRFYFNDYTNMQLNYNGRSAQPSTSQLMPVPDNSNPMSVSFGNPYLKPYFNHNARWNFGYTNMTSFTSINGNISGGMVQDAITNAQWYDKSGAQYSMPVNGPGTYNANAMIMINSPIGRSNFSIMSMTNGRFNQSTSYIGTTEFQNNEASKYYDPVTASFDYESFNKAFPTLEGSKFFTKNNTVSAGFMQMLRLTYRNDFIELVAGGRTNMSKSWYTVSSANQKATWTNNASFEMNWTLPFGMNLITDINYNWYNGYTTAQEPEFVWNAEITQLLFNNTCTIALRAYDILNQAKNLMVTDNSNYHMESRNNTLGRYIVLSFTYRFGTFGNNRGGRRGPDGMGGRGGRGMGGPGMGGPGMGGGRPPMGGPGMGGGRPF